MCPKRGCGLVPPTVTRSQRLVAARVCHLPFRYHCNHALPKSKRWTSFKYLLSRIPPTTFESLKLLCEIWRKTRKYTHPHKAIENNSNMILTPRNPSCWSHWFPTMFLCCGCCCCCYWSWKKRGERITQKEAIKDGRDSSKEIECIMMMNTTVIAESRRRSNVSFFMDPLPWVAGKVECMDVVGWCLIFLCGLIFVCLSAMNEPLNIGLTCGGKWSLWGEGVNFTFSRSQQSLSVPWRSWEYPPSCRSAGATRLSLNKVGIYSVTCTIPKDQRNMRFSGWFILALNPPNT